MLFEVVGGLERYPPRPFFPRSQQGHETVPFLTFLKKVRWFACPDLAVSDSVTEPAAEIRIVLRIGIWKIGQQPSRGNSCSEGEPKLNPEAVGDGSAIQRIVGRHRLGVFYRCLTDRFQLQRTRYDRAVDASAASASARSTAR